MPGASDLIQQVINDPIVGTLIIAGTGTISLGGYWLYRNDDRKYVSRATKVIFVLLTLVTVGTAGVIAYGKLRPPSKGNGRPGETASSTADPNAVDPAPPASDTPSEPPRAVDTPSEPSRTVGRPPSRSPPPPTTVATSDGIEAQGAASRSDATDDQTEKTASTVPAHPFWPRPTLRGPSDDQVSSVAECLWEDGRTGETSQCSRASADQFCRSAGYSRAESYSLRAADPDEWVYFYGRQVFTSGAPFTPKVYFPVLSDLTCQ